MGIKFIDTAPQTKAPDDSPLRSPWTVFLQPPDQCFLARRLPPSARNRSLVTAVRSPTTAATSRHPPVRSQFNHKSSVKPIFQTRSPVTTHSGVFSVFRFRPPAILHSLFFEIIITIKSRKLISKTNLDNSTSEELPMFTAGLTRTHRRQDFKYFALITMRIDPDTTLVAC
jgi:putative SOS response-associated peptidase YedK